MAARKQFQLCVPTLLPRNPATTQHSVSFASQHCHDAALSQPYNISEAFSCGCAVGLACCSCQTPASGVAGAHTRFQLGSMLRGPTLSLLSLLCWMCALLHLGTACSGEVSVARPGGTEVYVWLVLPHTPIAAMAAHAPSCARNAVLMHYCSIGLGANILHLRQAGSSGRVHSFKSAQRTGAKGPMKRQRGAQVFDFQHLQYLTCMCTDDQLMRATLHPQVLSRDALQCVDEMSRCMRFLARAKAPRLTPSPECRRSCQL